MDTFDDFLNSEDMVYIRTKYKDLDLDQLFSLEEFQAIFDGIEKTDYVQYGSSRWRDLETIINTIIQSKQKYFICKIKKLVLGYSVDMFPPINKYAYHYDINYGINYGINHQTNNL